jgi:hypothetical protein
MAYRSRSRSRDAPRMDYGSRPMDRRDSRGGDDSGPAHRFAGRGGGARPNFGRNDGPVRPGGGYASRGGDGYEYDARPNVRGGGYGNYRGSH